MRFVISTDPEFRRYGYGKHDPNDLNGRVEYFVSAAEETTCLQVPPASIVPVMLEPQERVYFKASGRWMVGRFEEYINNRLSLKLPNDRWREIEIEDAYVRSDLPLRDPLGLLQKRTTHTPFWHNHRTALVRALAEQRAAFRGLLGLASANIEIYEHQLIVVQRVLKDPVLRYILADEVGLGKTIEACTIIRQHVLDEDHEAREP